MKAHFLQMLKMQQAEDAAQRQDLLRLLGLVLPGAAAGLPPGEAGPGAGERAPRRAAAAFPLPPEALLMEEQMRVLRVLAEKERELMMKLARSGVGAGQNGRPPSLPPNLPPNTFHQGALRLKPDIKAEPDSELPLVPDNPTAPFPNHAAWDVPKPHDAVASSQPIRQLHRAVALAAQIEAEALTNGECPLDLTKASSTEEDSGIVHSTDGVGGVLGPDGVLRDGVLDYSPGIVSQRKRTIDSDVSNGQLRYSFSANASAHHK